MGLSRRGTRSDWTIALCRGVGGIKHDIVFEGASAQGEVSWVTPGVTSVISRTAPGPKQFRPESGQCERLNR
jgi:hypothetical protein